MTAQFDATIAAPRTEQLRAELTAQVCRHARRFGSAPFGNRLVFTPRIEERA